MYTQAKLNEDSSCYCENNNNYHNSGMLEKIKNLGEKLKRQDSFINKKPVRHIEIKKEEVLAIKNRFPNKIPVIVQRFHKERYLPQLEKTKFLVPQEINMGQFQTIIRNRIKMTNPNQALFIFINERSMLSMTMTLGEAYSEYSGPTGFLHVTYASQEVFGAEKCQA